ncbi:MAG: ferrous iron transport protein A [Bacteroidales bacterium]|nr:ferrous iron transport protein A [Bacteroidales bacterium]
MMIALTNMPVGKKGIIKDIDGGYGITHNLDVMGIHTGIEVTKVSKQWMRGPVTIRIGNNEIALGYGMATRIMVELI